MTEPALPETPSAAASAVESPPVDASVPIVAKAGRYYRNARFLMVLGLLIMGGLFFKDGYYSWPEQNRQIAENEAKLNVTPKESAEWFRLDAEQRRLGAPRNDTSIGLQKVLGYALPVVALAYLAFFLHKSRGEIRLQDDTLTVPGHPPVPLAAIQSVDESQWKKKGIATLRYEAGGTKGRITLDDFVYQQTPVDAIYDRILARLTVLKSGTTKDE